MGAGEKGLAGSQALRRGAHAAVVHDGTQQRKQLFVRRRANDFDGARRFEGFGVGQAPAFHDYYSDAKLFG
jgi:hypothetical protein